jgi:hypothetical protein
MAKHMLAIDCRRTGNLMAMNCGTLMQRSGEQAADGQTARLSLSIAPGCMPHGS